MPRSSVLVLVLAVATINVGPACTHDEAVRASILTDLTMPRGVLDRAEALTLRVLEGAVTCNDATGTIELPNGAEAAREVASSELGTTGCAVGARFCGDVTLEKSDAVRVFEAKAKGPGDAVLATGCTSSKVEQDALSIAIKMVRFLPPAVCGDGTLQPTEQCEPGGTELCDDSCQSSEILLSVGATSNGTATGRPGDKTDPYFSWPQGGGTQGRFFAFYTDRATTGGGANVEVGLRAMSDDLTPLTTPPALAAGSIFLPNGGTFPPQPTARQQSLPRAAFLQGKHYVVFQDDDTPGSSGLDIHLRSFDSSLQASPVGAPLAINGGATGEAAIQTAPAIAAGQDRLFIVWEDQGQGKVAGRTLTPPSTLGSQNDISVGNGNSKPDVAATSSGWVTVWKSGTGVKLRTVNEGGTPQGADQSVNESGAADRPRVASLQDGRFCVVWSAGGDIFFQRYDARGTKVAGDQSAPLNDIVKDGEQATPVVAAIATGAYVVAWLDVPTGHIRARFLGGSGGFLFNNVTGQASEFQASRADGRKRSNPAVASGGAEPFVAIGWEDQSASSSGIVARRFPAPTE